MNALHAVPTPSGDDGPLHVVTDAAVGEESVDRGTDPRTDAESLTLCALMWSTDTTTATRIAASLRPEDFDHPAYGALFTVIAALITAGEPHDPASVAATVLHAGGGPKDAPLRRAIADVVTADAPAESAPHYADIVLSQSYRRSFHVAGLRLVHAAEEGPEDELFDYMVELGIAQRAALRRLTAFRRGRMVDA